MKYQLVGRIEILPEPMYYNSLESILRFIHKTATCCCVRSRVDPRQLCFGTPKGKMGNVKPLSQIDVREDVTRYLQDNKNSQVSYEVGVYVPVSRA